MYCIHFNEASQKLRNGRQLPKKSKMETCGPFWYGSLHKLCHELLPLMKTKCKCQFREENNQHGVSSLLPFKLNVFWGILNEVTNQLHNMILCLKESNWNKCKLYTCMGIKGLFSSSKAILHYFINLLLLLITTITSGK